MKFDGDYIFRAELYSLKGKSLPKLNLKVYQKVYQSLPKLLKI